MSDVAALALRMGVSLSLVLGLTAMAYWFVRRRQAGHRSFGLAGRRARATSPKPLDVEARAGLARGSAAVAVRFADRVVLVAVTDGAPAAVLAEVPAADWDREIEAAEEEASAHPVRTPLDPHAPITERPSFLDALRDATSRRP